MDEKQAQNVAEQEVQVVAYNCGEGLRELFGKIREWAGARNILKGCTPLAQACKLSEEMNEVITAIVKGKFELLKDGIGDSVVVLDIIAAQLGADFEDVVNTSDYTQMLAQLEAVAALHPEKNRAGIIGTLNAQTSDIIGALYNYDIDNEESLADAVIAIEHLRRMYCTLYIIAHHYDLTLYECVNFAYGEIKDRKGEMRDGVFVKEADL